MTKARRARPRPARVVVPIIVVVAALAVAGVVWQLRSDTSTATPDPASSSSVGAGQESPSTSPSSGGTASGDPDSASPTATPAEVAAALKECRAKVAAGDDVIEAASTGVGHWSAHVQAQTDEFDGEITDAEMQTVFARTRLAGPDDLTRYDEATTDWDDADGSCAALDDASSADSTQLAFCGQRLTAMKPMMATADDAMGDWKSHLSDMRHSRMVHVDDAEQIWLDAWKAAPPHIKAFDKAADTYADAPDC